MFGSVFLFGQLSSSALSWH